MLLPQLNIAPTTGPSTSTSPYLVNTAAGVTFTSILTSGNMIVGYKFVGLPDGAVIFDNGDTTSLLFSIMSLVVPWVQRMLMDRQVPLYQMEDY